MLSKPEVVIKILLTLLMCLVCQFLSSHSVKALDSNFVIKGKVQTHSGEAVSDKEVLLMKLNMTKEPVKEIFSRTQSDQDGNFQFLINHTAASGFFRVETEVNKQMIGSEPFSIKKKDAPMVINLQLPQIYKGIKYLDFKKDILVVDYSGKSVRVTEIIDLENLSDGIVEVRSNPFVKKVPKDAFNLNIFRSQVSAEGELDNGRISFFLSIPPGEHQLFFGYDVPIRGASLEIQNFLPPGTEMFEVLFPKNDLDFELSENGKTDFQVLTSNKRLGQRIYTSKEVALNGSTKRVTVRVQNMPISQSKLTYPALILALILIFGFLFFLGKQSRLPQPI